MFNREWWRVLAAATLPTNSESHIKDIRYTYNRYSYNKVSDDAVAAEE